MSDFDDYSTSSDSDSGSEKDLNFNLRTNDKKNINYDEIINVNISDDDEIVNESDDDHVDDDDDDDDDDDENKNDNNEGDEIEEIGEVDGNLNEFNKIGYDSNQENIEDDDDEYDEEEDEEEEDEHIDVYNKSGGAVTKTISKSNQLNNKINIEPLNNDTDDSDNEDDNYLQKFNSDINKNYVSEFHPECLNHNYDEISALSKVTRDEFNIIIDPLHKTIPYLTKYEKARILGQRAKQIECGAKPLVKVSENIIDSYIIAELELQQKRIPFIIRRPLPNGGSEYWNLKDLEVITF